jgi:hypothetical protein
LSFNGALSSDALKTTLRIDGAALPLSFASTQSTLTGKCSALNQCCSHFFMFPAGSFQSLSLGGVSSSTTPFALSGDIAEMLVFARQLTPNEFSSVEAYLNYHWAL